MPYVHAAANASDDDLTDVPEDAPACSTGSDDDLQDCLEESLEAFKTFTDG